jgi:hypothetical protein
MGKKESKIIESPASFRMTREKPPIPPATGRIDLVKAREKLHKAMEYSRPKFGKGTK